MWWGREVLDIRAGMTVAELRAVAELEAACLAADGGRLKLEWDELRSRSTDRAQDVLWWDGPRLAGFLGLYSFGGADLEITGMVHPGHRRSGIATALLQAARELVAEDGYASSLLVCPRLPGAAGEFARSQGAVLRHSEHALVLRGAPTPGERDSRLSLRPARLEDRDIVIGLLDAAFGPRREHEQIWRTDAASVLVAELRDGGDQVPIGTLRVSGDADQAAVHGFGIDPAYQGRGFGRAVLRQACLQALAAGATSVALEVAVDNEAALGLYTSLGFEPVTTEDYWALPWP